MLQRRLSERMFIMRFFCFAAMFASLAFAQGNAFAADDGIPVARSEYQNRPLLPVCVPKTLSELMT
jgi:hypothetical protein